MSRAPVRPAGGFPWEQPGFTFQIGWPRGYTAPATPSAAELAARKKRRDKQRAYAASMKAQETIDPHKRFGTVGGTIAGMGPAAAGKKHGPALRVRK